MNKLPHWYAIVNDLNSFFFIMMHLVVLCLFNVISNSNVQLQIVMPCYIQHDIKSVAIMLM